MAGMERFTQRARRVLSLAHQEAERMHQNAISTEHVLLGLIEEEGGIAGRVLRDLGLEPERVREILSVVSDELIRFTQQRSELIGNLLARPGHGFASSRAGTGIGLSTDNLIMVSPAMFEEFCLVDCERIGESFGGELSVASAPGEGARFTLELPAAD